MAEHMARASTRWACRCSGSRSRTAAQRARHLARHRRRPDADVQRPHGHLVLGPRAVAAASPGSSRRPSSRTAALRPRDLEHEGRARLLRRGGARAAGRRRAAARRRPGRGRLRRDREDAVGRRVQRRRVPRLRGRLPTTSSRTAASRTCASSASRPRAGRARPLRLALAPHLHARQLHPHRVQRGQARTRTRSCGCTRCSTPCSSGSRLGDDPANSYRGARAIVNVGALEAASAGASRGRRIAPTSSSTCACRRRRRWRSRARGARHGARAPRSASPTTASRARSTSPRPARRSRRATRSSRRSTRRTRRSSARRRSAT